MNKFEQVSSDGHQMSLAGEDDTRELTCLTSGEYQDWTGWGQGGCTVSPMHQG